MCDGWAKFGGPSDQLDFRIVVLLLDFVEPAWAALIYASLVDAIIENLARRRDARADFSKFIRSDPSDARSKAAKENAGLSDITNKKEDGGR